LVSGGIDAWFEVMEGFSEDLLNSGGCIFLSGVEELSIKSIALEARN
jgi:hypothetical protein